MKDNKTNVFVKKLLTLVMPIAFQQFMLALVSASDAIMLGVLTQDALSAVSLASQIMTIGLSMLAAQYWGKKDKAAVERIFAYVMKITTAIAFVFFISASCFPRGLMRSCFPRGLMRIFTVCNFAIFSPEKGRAASK